jgi:hypothetical protein
MINTNAISLILQLLMSRQGMGGVPGMGPGSGCGCNPMPGMGMGPADAFAGSQDLSSMMSPGGVGATPNFGSSFGARPPMGGAPAGGAGPMGAMGQGGNSGSKAVDIARQFNGQASHSLKGKLPGFTAPGGKTNNCAAFVSACLENAGSIPKGKGSASVAQLRKNLQGLGWRKIPPQQAKPGDVWMTRPGQGSHTELVSQQGGGRTIGSNNNGQKGFQRISERGKGQGSGEIWAKR